MKGRDILCRLAVWYLKRQKLDFVHNTGRGMKGRFMASERVVVTVNGRTAFYMYKYKPVSKENFLVGIKGPQGITGSDKPCAGGRGYQDSVGIA